MITEKYRPQLSEIVGNKQSLEKLEKCIVEKTPCLLWGNPGIGKTSSVYAVAEKLQYNILETNASDQRRKEDLLNILRMARMRGLGKEFVVLLDECDGIKTGGLVSKILDQSVHPLVLVCNDLYRVPQAIKEKCIRIRFYQPSLTEVLSRVKVVAGKEGVRPQYNQISGDVRSSINTAVYGGEKYEVENDFEKVQDVFRGNPVERVDRDFLVWLVDNASRFYSGRRLFEVIQVVVEADRTGRMELLKLLPKGKHERARYPYFLRRMRVLRGEKR